MLQALLDDLIGVEGLDITVMRDFRLPPLAQAVTTQTIHAPAEFDLLFDTCLAASDAVWPIAPESDETLQRISRRIQDSGKHLLGSSPEAVQLASSKIASSRTLTWAGIPTIPTFHSACLLGAYRGPVVVKPDDGAGCQQTYYFDAPGAVDAWMSAHPESVYVVQPYLPGAALSLSLLCQNTRARILSCNRQRVSIRDGVFHFEGADAGAGGDSAGYQQLADAIARAVPGLWGYVGVDFMETREGPVVIEINPRLTTAYVGLGKAIGLNPARLVLGLIDPVWSEETAMGSAYA